MDSIKASIDKYIEAVYHLLNAAAVMGLNEYQDLREVVQKYYSSSTSSPKVIEQQNNQNTAILDMLTEQEQLEEHMNQRRRQYQAEQQTTQTQTITEQPNTDLNDVIKEAEARNAELQNLNQTPPNTPNPEEQINTVVESNSSTPSGPNESITVEDNPVSQRKEPPTINALFRLTPRQRDELCYQLFMTAKKNVTRLCPENTPQEEIDRLVKNEADRLLDVYIKTH